jgi:hypothetical protein
MAAGSTLAATLPRCTVKGTSLPVGKWIIVSWDSPERRDWYGCLPGKILRYDDTLKRYTVEHYDCEVPYSLYYSRTELTATFWERLIFKMQKFRTERKKK